MVYVIAALLGVSGWLVALITRAFFTWAVTIRHQKQNATPQRLAQVRAPLDAVLGGVVDEPIRFGALWWLITVTATGTFTLTATSAPDGVLVLAVVFALGWALAEVVHLVAVVTAASRTTDEKMRQQFKASGLTDSKTISLRVGAALLRNIGLTLTLVALPALVLVTLVARAAAGLLAVRSHVSSTSHKAQNTLLTSGFLAAVIFAAVGGILAAIS